MSFDDLPSRYSEILASRLRSLLVVQVVAVRHGEHHLLPSDRQRARRGRRQDVFHGSCRATCRRSIRSSW